MMMSCPVLSFVSSAAPSSVSKTVMMERRRGELS